MKVFLDTNVLISAFATRGLCEDVMRAVLIEHELVVGEVVLEELQRVLETKFAVPLEIVQGLVDLLSQQRVVPRPDRPADIDIRDASDRWILASAIAGRADVLVTGDRDLLELESAGGLQILSPRGFWTLLTGK
ncbi:MAG: putative toxin-antitoxin system toxin component, PIN family [Gammaproteobacteria bacterium]|nr:putative toxin-antitoxin system toxin component, PIN family [Gammaproteobacteria bacterium]